VERKAIQDVEFILERIEKRWQLACNRRIEVLEVTSPVAAFYIRGCQEKIPLPRLEERRNSFSHPALVLERESVIFPLLPIHFAGVTTPIGF
jgi:hypothetical protein